MEPTSLKMISKISTTDMIQAVKIGNIFALFLVVAIRWVLLIEAYTILISIGLQSVGVICHIIRR